MLNLRNKPPRISIVTPSFNQAQFLERTIQSVLDQGYPNLEYIIMDGRSTDGSVDIIKKYADQLAHWISEPDKGQADAIRKGFEKATGEIFAWLNSDDTYEPGALFKVANAFRDNPDVDLIFGDYLWIDEEDNKICEIKHPDFNFETLVYVGGSLHQTGAFWTKTIYTRVGGLDPGFQFCMDTDLFCRIAEVGKLMHIPEILSNFRQQSNSKTALISKIGAQENTTIANRYIPQYQSKLVRSMIEARCELRRLISFIRRGNTEYVVKKVFRRINEYF